MTAGALAAIAALVAINAFFVSAEFALVSVRPEQLPTTRAGQRVRHQTSHLDEYLAACQVGVTIASLALGALGEPTIRRLLEPRLGDLANVGAILATVLALLIITALHITIGEQAPKSFAIGSAARVAMICAWPLEVFDRALRPLVLALNAASNGVVRLVGGTPATSHASQASLDELRRLISAVPSDELGAGDRQLLQGVFTLDERTAADVMTPRHRVVTLRTSDSVERALAETRGSGHSRFPLLDEAGRVVGLILLRDLVDALLDGLRTEPVTELRHEIVVAPPAQRLDVLLERLRAERTSLAVIDDEYGDFEGVVAIEDIVEELVGEIWDEDDRPNRIRRLANNSFVVDGDAALDDLARQGINVAHATDVASVGGLIQELLGRVPRRGDQVSAGTLVLEVLSTQGQRVERVLIRPAEHAPVSSA
jgi:CBS domain containing-hemolysin-like protein